jgi:hypothetical protein
MNNEIGSKSDNPRGIKAPPVEDKDFTIIVNGTKNEWKGREISFDEVVILAFGSVSTSPNTIYSITYKRGHGDKPEGTMVRGDIVKLKEGMVFNATCTDRS